MRAKTANGTTRIRTALLLLSAGALLAGCSSGATAEDDDPDQTTVITDEGPEEDDAPAEDPVDDGADGGGEGDEGGAIILPTRTIDQTVYYNELEYTVGEVRVVDLDHEADNLPQRIQGLHVEVDLDAFNPGSTQASTNASTALDWVDPESGLAYQAHGARGQAAGVPGGGRANLTLEYQVHAPDAETFSLETGALVFGTEGRHAAVVPLGGERELEDKFMHFQDDMVGTVFDFEGGDVTFTIDEAYIAYDLGGSRLEDSEVLLEFMYTFVNNTEHQHCHYRGTGENFQMIHATTGIGATDLGTERCVGAGAQEQWFSGLTLPADEFTGTWTMTVNLEYASAIAVREDMQQEAEFEIVENPLSIADWPTR